MRRMPNIELSDQELSKIISDGKFDYGGEAIVCRNNNPHSLYKIFTHPETDVVAMMSDNKLKKISWIYQHQLEDTVLPLATLSNHRTLIGYEMTFDPDDEALINAILTEGEKIHFLHSSADILRYYGTRDVTYGDVKDDNILINKKTGKAKFCDIDNIRVESLPIDIMGYGLSDYFDVVPVIDQKADAYMHNLLFLEQLKYNNLSHRAILNRLRAKPIMPEFPEEVERIISTLIEPEKFNGEYAIQYIKRRWLNDYYA